MPLTRREALTRIQRMGTHTFYTPEFAHEVQRAFGMEEETETIRANTKDPLGLFVEGVAPDTPVEGYASHDLTTTIVAHLGLRVKGYFGRGTQQRANEEEIDRYLKEAGE